MCMIMVVGKHEDLSHLPHVTKKMIKVLERVENAFGSCFCNVYLIVPAYQEVYVLRTKYTLP